MKYLLFAIAIALFSVGAYELGFHVGQGSTAAHGAKGGDAVFSSGNTHGLQATLVAGATGRAVDWQTLLKSKDELDPSLLAAWARSLDPGVAAEIIRQLKAQPPNLRRNDLLGALYDAAAERDPKDFLADTNGITVPKLREQGIDTALKTWAAQDPQAALEWIKNNPGTASAAAGDERFAAAIAGFASTDPAGALATVSALSDSDPRDRAQKSAATKALADALSAQGDFTQAATFFNELPQGQMRTDAYSELAQQWTNISPTDAATWVEGITNDPTLKAAMGAEVAQNWAMTDPASAATWAAKIDAQDTTPGNTENSPEGTLLATTIRAWTTYDLDSAGQFLNLLPTSPTKDPAVAIFALRASQEDPQGAFQWVSTISDPQMRNGLTVGLSLLWMQQDQAGFNQFLSTSPLLNDDQRQMISTIPAQAAQSLSQLNTVLGGGDSVQTVLENSILNGRGMVGAHGEENAPNPGTTTPGNGSGN
jgi:hypothetical protein